MRLLMSNNLVNLQSGLSVTKHTRTSSVRSHSWRTMVILSFKDGISPSTYDYMKDDRRKNI